MSITAFNAMTAHNISRRIAQKMEELEDEFGISFEVGKYRYDSSHIAIQITSKLDMPLENTDEGRAFKSLATRYGLRPEMLGDTFVLGDDLYRITGIKTSRPKYPISGQRVSDGKGYKFTERQVRSAMGIGA